MTVKVTKPSINLREELASLNKPSGIVGESILRADTAADAVEQLNLEDHTFTTFTSTGIDDNATSTAMTLDSSGNLLVGKTTTGATSAGMAWISNEYLQLANTETGAGDRALLINRQSADGTMIEFRKANTPVGTIGSRLGANLLLASNGGSVYTDDNFRPNADNAYDIGLSSLRFKDLYATNGTIQTSDRNEKQDIAELTDAEQRVAVAAKGLLRKFRWRDAVEAKGDEARTHFGIIAQDLQAAFAAEGLDAGDYAMFIHTTWTDEETGEEKSRMGVRYSELLAFIIAAI